METPKKIYLQSCWCSGAFVPSTTWSEDSRKGYDNIEYINRELIDKININGQSLDVWKEWLENELEPPVKCDDETAYVLSSFLTLIKNVQGI